MQVDLTAHREKENWRRMETEGGEGEDETQEQEMKDALEDRMRAMPNSNIKTDRNLEKKVKEKAGKLELEQNRLSYERERESMCAKSNYPVVLASVRAD